MRRIITPDHSADCFYFTTIYLTPNYPSLLVVAGLILPAILQFSSFVVLVPLIQASARQLLRSQALDKTWPPVTLRDGLDTLMAHPTPRESTVAEIWRFLQTRPPNIHRSSRSTILGTHNNYRDPGAFPVCKERLSINIAGNQNKNVW